MPEVRLFRADIIAQKDISHYFAFQLCGNFWTPASQFLDAYSVIKYVPFQTTLACHDSKFHWVINCPRNDHDKQKYRRFDTTGWWWGGRGRLAVTLLYTLRTREGSVKTGARSSSGLFRREGETRGKTSAQHKWKWSRPAKLWSPFYLIVSLIATGQVPLNKISFFYLFYVTEPC